MTKKKEPAEARRKQRELSIDNWSPSRARFTLTLPSGMVVEDCTYHSRDEESWIALPSVPYADDDGNRVDRPVITFASEEAKQGFQNEVLAAIEHLFGWDETANYEDLFPEERLGVEDRD